MRCSILLASALFLAAGCEAGEIVDPALAADPDEAAADLTTAFNPKASFRGLSLGTGSTCVVRPDGATRCWGHNQTGRVGNGTAGAAVLTPAAVKALGETIDVETEWLGSCAVTLADGLVACWGDNSYGQLGNTSGVRSAVPVIVPGLAGVVDVSVGLGFACALRANGDVACWGGNGNQQVGAICPGASCATPVPVSIIRVAAIDSGDAHTCALTTAGAVQCWGASWKGQAGQNGGQVGVPRVVVASGAIAISVSGNTSCALLADGRVQCWGDNGHGQLGFAPTTTAHPAPVTVPGLSGARDLALGFDHACATLASGASKCWGRNGAGQLGNGVTANFLPPVTVAGGRAFQHLEAGGSHTCGVTTSNELYCWGAGGSGELGVGTKGNALVPVKVVP